MRKVKCEHRAWGKVIIDGERYYHCNNCGLTARTPIEGPDFLPTHNIKGQHQEDGK